jgi:hypothetical protein
MFHLHTALAVQLLTLIAAAALLAWTGNTHTHAKNLVRGISYSVIVVSMLSVLCTGYYGAKYSRAGYFETPTGMRHAMMPKGMMGGGMMKKDAMNDEGVSPDSKTPHSHDHGE